MGFQDSQIARDVHLLHTYTTGAMHSKKRIIIMHLNKKIEK